MENFKLLFGLVRFTSYTVFEFVFIQVVRLVLVRVRKRGNSLRALMSERFIKEHISLLLVFIAMKS